MKLPLFFCVVFLLIAIFGKIVLDRVPKRSPLPPPVSDVVEIDIQDLKKRRNHEVKVSKPNENTTPKTRPFTVIGPVPGPPENEKGLVAKVRDFLTKVSVKFSPC